MVDITFKLKIDKDSIKKKVDAYNKSIDRKSPKIIKSTLESLNTLGSIRKFREFIKTDRFRADLGINANIQNEMIRSVENIFNGEQVTFSRRGDEFLFTFIPEDALRDATETIWFKTSGKGGIILVNAWDIYEYGIIGGNKTRGIIKKYMIKYDLNTAEKRRSRSGLALMIRNASKNFRFDKAGAPRIGAIRAEIAANKKKLAKAFADGL